MALMLALVGCGQGAATTTTSAPVAPASVAATAPGQDAMPPQPAAPSSASSSTSTPSTPAPSAGRVEDDALPRVVDLHVDTPWQVHFKGRAIDLPEGQATMQGLKTGRYAAITYPIYIADSLHDGRPTIADADAILKTIDALISKHADVLWDPRGGGAPPRDRVEALISIEGAGAFADDITQIDRFIARGVRFVGPVHAADNRLASSATGKKPGYGLTDAGKALCRRVYAAGALVDVSHMSDAAFADLLPIAAEVGAPLVATHSNARAVADQPRNLTDDQLRTIARTGGVAGLNLHSAFLRKGAAASMDDAVKQAKHMIEVAGFEHVAIGSDFDGASPPADLGDASRMPSLAEALEKAGVPRAQVRAIFEGNARRVLAWKPRARP
jgi:membrane dipeptidase